MSIRQRFSLTVIGIVAFCLLLLGCESSALKRGEEVRAWFAENGKLKVLSTTAMIDDLVRQIGGTRVDPLLLISGDIDPHTYELVKGDEEKLSFAQLIFYNGLSLEHGASLRYRLQNHPRAIALGNLIRQKKPTAILWIDGQIDPHLWMDVSLWVEAVTPIVEALTRADPQGASFYREKGASLQEKMLVTHEKMRMAMQEIPLDKRFLVSSHAVFSYFARGYLASEEEKTDTTWQKRVASPEGLAPDGQLSTRDIQRIVAYIQEHKIQVVFPESNVSRSSLQKVIDVCHQKGIKVRMADQVLYGDALDAHLFQEDPYLHMMQHNISILKEMWKK